MIPFIDLAAQQQRIRPVIEANIKRLLDHGHYIMGPEVQELEQKLCEFCGARFCITCSSGTDALLMPLMAWGIGAGDAVFVPAFSFFATAEMPALLGAEPVFVDIDPVTFNMDAGCLAKAIQKVEAEGKLRPAAVIPVDLFGQPASYADILPVARKYGLLTLEDAAQAFGAAQAGKKTCNLGCQAAATSFFPAKPLGCYGDGGAIFTDDEALASTLRSIRIHGKGANKYDNTRIGLNGRLDTFQAAILLAKLEIFNDELERRNQVAQCYAEALANIAAVTRPTLLPGNTSSWAQYSILVPASKRDYLADALNRAGIPTNIYYPVPLPMLKAFAYLKNDAQMFPVANEASHRILALPFHPYLERETIFHISEIIRSALA